MIVWPNCHAFCTEAGFWRHRHIKKDREKKKVKGHHTRSFCLLRHSWRSISALSSYPCYWLHFLFFFISHSHYFPSRSADSLKSIVQHISGEYTPETCDIIRGGAIYGPSFALAFFFFFLRLFTCNPDLPCFKQVSPWRAPVCLMRMPLTSRSIEYCQWNVFATSFAMRRKRRFTSVFEAAVTVTRCTAVLNLRTWK